MGFEPTVPVNRAHGVSSAAPSSARPPLLPKVINITHRYKKVKRLKAPRPLGGRSYLYFFKRYSREAIPKREEAVSKKAWDTKATSIPLLKSSPRKSFRATEKEAS